MSLHYAQEASVMRLVIAFGLLLIGSTAMAGMAREQKSIPKPVAEAIIAKAESLGERIQRQVNSSRDVDSKLTELSGVIEHSSQWRYYHRDRGILIAISVNKRLNYLDRLAAEDEIAGLAERLVLQSDDQSVAGGIRVVFIEPESACTCPRSAMSQTGGMPVGVGTACGCR